MQVIVTGGAGYVGAHICKALFHYGYEPIAVDHLHLGHQEAVLWGPLEIGDIRDHNFLDRVFHRYQPVGVIHCAGLSCIRDSIRLSDEYYQNNVVGSLEILRAMQRHQVNHFIFSSSCAIFGPMRKRPIAEDHPTQPLSPYGWSKLMTEQIARDFHCSHGVRYALLRYFNAAGADPEGQIGETHDPETHLIPLIFDAMLGRIPYLSVFGEHYKTPDGSPVRDYIHVTDLAEAHAMCLQRLQQTAECLEFNLGSGKGYSVKQVIQAAERVTGCQVPVKITPGRQGDPAILVADSRKIRSTLDWTPRHSDLDTILRTAWQWHRRQYGGLCAEP